MELINPQVLAYAEQFTSSLDELGEEVAATTEASHPRAQMMSSRLQGKFLEIFSILLQPKRVLEIGTFTGFSALCLARGLASGGMLHTIELREEEAQTARAYFNRSNYQDRIILHTGNALTIIPELDEAWDLVFIDADKTGYVKYYEVILQKLRSGGVIIADNVLFHGEVLQEPVKGKNALAIKEFNDMVRSDDRVEHVLLTLRDGLMIIRKK